jgi:tetratricopeptide (TPR) repeat protein
VLFGVAFWLLAASPYEGLMARAEAAYRAVELREAAALYRRAAAAADAAEARATALLWAALSLGQAGDLDEARAEFDDALRVWCIDALPTRVSPKVDEVFGAARAAATCTRPDATTHDPGEPTPTPTPTPAPPPPAAPPLSPSLASSASERAPASPSAGLSLPVAVGTGGGILAAIGLVVAAKGGVDVLQAADSRTPQIEAQALLDQGNLELAIGAIVGIAGVSVVGAGALLALGEHSDD